jgi:hypothetical protein
MYWICLAQDGDCGLDLSGSTWGPVRGSYEHGNEPCGSIKDWEVV